MFAAHIVNHRTALMALILLCCAAPSFATPVTVPTMANPNCWGVTTVYDDEGNNIWAVVSLSGYYGECGTAPELNVVDISDTITNAATAAAAVADLESRVSALEAGEGSSGGESGGTTSGNLWGLPELSIEDAQTIGWAIVGLLVVVLSIVVINNIILKGR